jgi:hypothetical protein
MTHFTEHNSSNAMGPRACNFCVLMPISAPRPNSKPSVKRVLAFQYTAAESTCSRKRSALALSAVTMASLCWLP